MGSLEEQRGIPKWGGGREGTIEEKGEGAMQVEKTAKRKN